MSQKELKKLQLKLPSKKPTAQVTGQVAMNGDFCMNSIKLPEHALQKRESHYLWGKRYMMHMDETGRALLVERGHSILTLELPPDTPIPKREEGLEAWYGEELRKRAMGLIPKWEKIIGVKVKRLCISKIKIGWSSSDPESGTIELNADLARHPLDCMEYILVLAMVHLREPSHDAHCVSLMDSFMPKWRLQRERLDALTGRQEDKRADMESALTGSRWETE